MTSPFQTGFNSGKKLAESQSAQLFGLTTMLATVISEGGVMSDDADLTIKQKLVGELSTLRQNAKSVLHAAQTDLASLFNIPAMQDDPNGVSGMLEYSIGFAVGVEHAVAALEVEIDNLRAKIAAKPLTEPPTSGTLH
jgi:hypothetical protein